jgi:hypothetical protein
MCQIQIVIVIVLLYMLPAVAAPSGGVRLERRGISISRSRLQRIAAPITPCRGIFLCCYS